MYTYIIYCVCIDSLENFDKEKKPSNQRLKQIKPQQNRAVTSADAIEVNFSFLEPSCETGWREGRWGWNASFATTFW